MALRSQYVEHMLKSLHRDAVIEKFKEVDEAKLAKMSAKELAEWQYAQSEDSPHQILVAHEWQRRLIAEQVRWMKYSIWAAVVSALLGAVVGSVLAYELQPQSQKKEEQAYGASAAKPSSAPKDESTKPPVSAAPAAPPTKQNAQPATTANAGK